MRDFKEFGNIYVAYRWCKCHTYPSRDQTGGMGCMHTCVVVIMSFMVFEILCIYISSVIALMFGRNSMQCDSSQSILRYVIMAIDMHSVVVTIYTTTECNGVSAPHHNP